VEGWYEIQPLSAAFDTQNSASADSTSHHMSLIWSPEPFRRCTHFLVVILFQPKGQQCNIGGPKRGYSAPGPVVAGQSPAITCSFRKALLWVPQLISAYGVLCLLAKPLERFFCERVFVLHQVSWTFCLARSLIPNPLLYPSIEDDTCLICS
jgi:hypothetical protein